MRNNRYLPTRSSSSAGAPGLLQRLRQEAGNVAQLVWNPSLGASVDVPRLDLPDAVWGARRVKGSPYALEVEQLANAILADRDSGTSSGGAQQQEGKPGYFGFLQIGDAEEARAAWMRNRHQDLVLLAQAAEIAGSGGTSPAIDAIMRRLEAWWEQNPYERGINWTNPAEAGLRAVSWIWVFHIAGKRFSAEFRRKLLTGIYRHGCYLSNNLGRTAGLPAATPLESLREAVALHAIGALFPQFPKAQRWKAAGRDIVRREMETEVRPDGSHSSQSSHYHVQAMDMFLFHLAIETDAPLVYKDRLGKMAAYLDALLGPRRIMPLLGDDDGGRFFHPYGAGGPEQYGRATLATAGLLLEQRAADYGFEESDVYEQAIWWLSSRLLRSVSRPRDPRGGDYQFPDAGLSTAVRDELSVAFHWGTCGAAQRHSDVLSFTARLGEEELLIDSGTYLFADPWYRSTAAHNTVRVDGMDQIAPAVVNHADAWTATVSYQGGITHKRHVNVFRAGLVIVTDEIEGAGGGERFLEQFWHTGVEVRMISPSCFALGERARLHLQPGTSRDWEVGGEFGWRSRAYGSKEACAVVRASLRTALPAKLVAVIDLNGSYDEWPLS